MKKVITWGVVLALALFLGTGIATWAGSIILPEIGLHNAPYWTWFKFNFVMFLGGFVGGLVKIGIKEFML